jgi:hypothetical protein
VTTPDFSSPNFQGGSGLQINIGPLGLVELSDSEFEVSGPRLNRYAINAAFFLGKHWAYQREAGDAQLTFNWFRTFTDFIAVFTFGRGVTFETPKQTEAIIPDLLQRIWETDNTKAAVLWEIGQQGGVYGDAFIKVAYEEAFVDSIGRVRPGRVRILPLQAAHCFPEYHPHDRERIIRFKLKYRFYGQSPEGTRQMYTYTEIITDDSIAEYINDNLIQADGIPNPRPNPIGKVPVVHIANTLVSGSPWGLADCQDIIALNREYNEKATEISDIINYHCVDGETEVLTQRGWLRYDELTTMDDALALDPDTDEIRWSPVQAVNVYEHNGPLVRWDNRIDAVTTPNHRWVAERRIGRPENRRYEREIVRTSVASEGDLAASDMGQGSRLILGGGTAVHFPTEAKWDDEFVETIGWLVTEGCLTTLPSGSQVTFLSQSIRENEQHVAEIRRLGAYWRARGGAFTEQRERESGVVCWYLGTSITDALLAASPDKALTAQFLTQLTYRQAVRLREILIDADGTRLENGREAWYQDDLGRRDGFQMLSAMIDGSRTRSFENNRGHGIVDTYQTRTIEVHSTTNRATEVENPSGVVWCPTTETGTWFARRNGITYWTGNSAPVTVVLGAKASNLEKGPKKVWAIPTVGADVKNLELGAGLDGPMAFLELLKRSMHEMTGVPETALGQVQPISNTSGVALSIQFQPLMARFHQKVNQYAKGIEDINELALLTLFMKEPQTLAFDPTMDLSPLKPGQLEVLDPADPITYRSKVHFPLPLPIDKLILLNEIQLLQSIGLESREGALRQLGEEDPAEKLAEIRQELKDDAIADGALQLIKTQIQSEIMNLTGIMPTPDGGELPPMQDGAPDALGNTTASPQMPQPVVDMAQMMEIQGEQDIRNQLVTDAYGTRLPTRQNPTDKEQGSA